MSMKINRLEIENVKRIKAVKLEPAQNGLTIIGGDNQQGKTSVLDSIAWALGGERYKPSQSTREGSMVPPNLHIVMNNGLVVERKGKNSALKVTDPNGQKAGQQLLNEFVEQLALDLPRFMEASGTEKAKVLLQIIGVGPQLAELEQEERELYQERLYVGRTADQKEKFAKEQPYYPEAPRDLVSPSELIRQQQEILAKNGENQRKRDQAAQLRDSVKRAHEEVTRLSELLETAKQKHLQLVKDLDIAETSAKDLTDQSTEELEANISNIEEINRKVRANLDKEKAEDDAKEYRTKYDNQATGRCSVKGSKFWFNCNPDGPYHWFKVNWIDKATGYLGKEQVRKIRQKAKVEGKDPGLKELLYLHFTMDDNLSLDEEVKARYRSMYIGVFFKRYILGLWAAAEGVIYDMFDEARHVRDIKDFFQLLINGNRYVSCDYGTQNATVFLLWNKGRDGVWYCIREYYYSGRDKGKQKTDSEYADDLKKWLDGTKIKAIIVDPSAASFIAELRKRGYKVLKANNDVLDGIRLVGMLLNLELLKFASSCTETIKEFASYIWDEKALERGEDKPVKQHDHSCDAVRYFVSTVLGSRVARLREISR